MIYKVVDHSQAGFIPGRVISDNVLLASELVKGYNRKYNEPKCMIKVDLQKAYDSVEWEFLENVLSELGFPKLYIDWVMSCVRSVSFSVLINGKPGPVIKARRELRQGDPISPYLFALCMEYLSR